MRAVAARVSSASVVVAGQTVGAIDAGLLVLVGVTHQDTPATARQLAGKLYQLRILPGERSCADNGQPLLIVSQFTLYGDTRKGRRPSWQQAAPSSVAQNLIDELVVELRRIGASVQTGLFGAEMAVTSTNDGPFTVIVEV